MSTWSEPIPEVGTQSPPPIQLPPLVEWLDFASSEIAEPATIVEGILHRGSKMVLGGGSKSFKTWTLVDLALSVASGSPWWDIETSEGKVCYVNLEIQEYFFRRRCLDVADAKGIMIPKDNLFIWNLRGYAADISSIHTQMTDALKTRNLSLIVVDPIYKIMGGRDENSTRDIANLLNHIEKLAVETGAAVVFGSHFAKGNPALKEAIDRISGSGVYARDPDSILTLTRHQEENRFVVEPVLRNFPPMPSFVVQWLHPLMSRDNGADPAELKGVKGGRPRKFEPESLVAILDLNSMSKKEWMNAAMNIHGMSEATFKRLASEAQTKGLVEKNGNKFRRQLTPNLPGGSNGS